MFDLFFMGALLTQTASRDNNGMNKELNYLLCNLGFAHYIYGKLNDNSLTECETCETLKYLTKYY